MIDLPGAYSLTPATPDEQITLEVIEGRRPGEAAPDAIVAVVDATNLRMNLRLVLELKQLGRPMMVALNMADVARAEGPGDRRRQARRRARLPGGRDGGGARTTATPGCSRCSRRDSARRRRRERSATRRRPRDAHVREARSSADLQLEVRRILALAAPGAAAVQPLPAPHRRAS